MFETIKKKKNNNNNFNNNNNNNNNNSKEIPNKCDTLNDTKQPTQGAVVMKNWEPLVFGPLFAMQSM